MKKRNSRITRVTGTGPGQAKIVELNPTFQHPSRYPKDFSLSG